MKSDHSRIRLESSGKNKVIGWELTLSETMKFFKDQRKTVVTLLGYSADYEDKKAMLKIVENVLAVYNAVINALPRKKENLKSILIKFTMSKPKKLEIK